MAVSRTSKIMLSQCREIYRIAFASCLWGTDWSERIKNLSSSWRHGPDSQSTLFIRPLQLHHPHPEHYRIRQWNCKRAVLLLTTCTHCSPHPHPTTIVFRLAYFRGIFTPPPCYSLPLAIFSLATTTTPLQSTNVAEYCRSKKSLRQETRREAAVVFQPFLRGPQEASWQRRAQKILWPHVLVRYAQSRTPFGRQYMLLWQRVPPVTKGTTPHSSKEPHLKHKADSRLHLKIAKVGPTYNLLAPCSASEWTFGSEGLSFPNV